MKSEWSTERHPTMSVYITNTIVFVSHVDIFYHTTLFIFEYAEGDREWCRILYLGYHTLVKEYPFNKI